MRKLILPALIIFGVAAIYLMTRDGSKVNRELPRPQKVQENVTQNTLKETHKVKEQPLVLPTLSERFDKTEGMSDAYNIIRSELEKTKPLGVRADRHELIELCERFIARWPKEEALGLGLLSQCHAMNGKADIALGYQSRAAESYEKYVKGTQLELGESEADAAAAGYNCAAQLIYNEAIFYYSRKAYAEALNYFELTRTKYPNSSQTTMAGLLSAECYAGLTQFANAVQILKQVIKENPKVPLLRRAYAQLARLQHKMGEPEEAFRTLDEFSTVSESGAEASCLKGELLFLEGAPSAEKAIEAYSITKSKFPDTDYAKEADRMIGIITEHFIKPKAAVKPPAPPEK